MKQWSIWTLAAVFTLMASAASAQDRITAQMVADELDGMGYSFSIDQDESGDPRVNTTVDGYRWSVYFYDCASGDLADRPCVSFQFYSGYQVPKSFQLETLNKWNTEKRYAKAYLSDQKGQDAYARLEIDVVIEGTQSDPRQAFRAYFERMKNAAEAFRTAINFE
jgi:hypothetical protein